MNNPALQSKITHLRRPLAPLVSLTTSAPHPRFPSTLLNYWVLTEPELDELAAYYHQRTPGPYTGAYPECMRWDREATLEVKRRKFGRFVGLRGCESPVEKEEARVERGQGHGLGDREGEGKRREDLAGVEFGGGVCGRESWGCGRFGY